jgi:hypothetical protein
MNDNAGNFRRSVVCNPILKHEVADDLDLTNEIVPLKRRSKVRRFKSVDGLFLEPIEEIPKISARTKSFDLCFEDISGEAGHHGENKHSSNEFAQNMRRTELMHGNSFADSQTGEDSYLCDDSSDEDEDENLVHGLPLYHLSFNEQDCTSVGAGVKERSKTSRGIVQANISDDDISFLPPIARTIRSYPSRENSIYRGTSFETIELNEKPKEADSEDFGRYITPINSMHASDSFVLQQNLHHEKCVIRPEKFLTADHSFRLPLMRGFSSHCSNDGPMFARIAAKKSMVSRVNSMKPTRKSPLVQDLPSDKSNTKCTLDSARGLALDDLTKKLERISGMSENVFTWDMDEEFQPSAPPCFGLKRKESIKRQQNVRGPECELSTPTFFHQSCRTLETEDISVFSSEKDSECDYIEH